jgi:ubiquinone/menaquinone biosynthesis C-methylase UbiE
MEQQPFTTIAEAFSRTAAKYDAFAEDHPNLTRMRSRVYAHISRVLPPPARILELNAGTGSDAVQLARRGYRLHATDIAPGMLQRLEDKISRMGLGEQVTLQQCSFTDLSSMQGAPYDSVFSNLGGLNCVPDLTPVIQALPEVLRPGGVVTWVLMPPVCLWELGMAFTGQVGFATRRLRRNGTRAHLEGLYFKVYYFTPRQVAAWFGQDYEVLALEGLSVVTPPAESKNLAWRHPRFYRLLSRIDDHLCTRKPWWGWGDFFILSLRYQPRRK